MKRVRPGDIIEIPTSNGMSYALYIMKKIQWGALISIFNKNYETRPANVESSVSGSPSFQIFFPLTTAVNRSIFLVVGHISLPSEASQFPLFRDGVPDPITRRVGVWWLWDGENEWRVGDLSPEQRKLPIRQIANDTMLIHLIESGWTPEEEGADLNPHPPTPLARAPPSPEGRGDWVFFSSPGGRGRGPSRSDGKVRGSHLASWSSAAIV